MKRVLLAVVFSTGCATTWTRTVTYSEGGTTKSEKSEGRCSELLPVAGRIDIECAEKQENGSGPSALHVISIVLLVPLTLISVSGPR